MAQPMMALALAQAEQALYLSSPNPRVGCVLVRADQTIIGQGHTQRAGQAHAEVMAVRDAQTQGHGTQGATAYVTLEPCCHQGRTGPCTQVLIDAGIQRVVVAMPDPNPLVAFKGLAALRAAGLKVDVLRPTHPLAQRAAELNRGFVQRMTQGVPWVRAKVAASLDGITALASHESQWITSEAARQDAHHYRASACALLTGIGTVLADDPRLDVRHVPTLRQPALVIVDGRLRLPTTAKLFEPTQPTQPPRPIWIYTASDERGKVAALQARGAEVRLLADQKEKGRVDLAAMMRDLAQRGINELHVEAGFTLNGALSKAGLIDEWLVYLAPCFLGTGRGMVDHTLPHLAAVERMRLLSIASIGQDLRGIWRTERFAAHESTQED